MLQLEVDMAESPASGGDLAFVPVAVAGAPTVQVCIDTTAADPVAAWFADHDWIDEPVQRAFLELVRPGSRVLDLGCHLGTFSLAAAAVGACVLAVDAAPGHVNLLRRAARRNGFNELKVVHAAIADGGCSDAVPFLVRSIHGHVDPSGRSSNETIQVPAASVDQLLETVGWDGVDVVKMDIEGSEMSALRGMKDLLAQGARPNMVLESNAAMLELFDSSVVELRTVLADLGYELLLIDHLRPGTLVETQPATVQTECASDVLALSSRPIGLTRRWRIEPGLSKETTVARVLDAAASPAAGYRRATADLLRHGPRWLRDAPGVTPAITALEHDLAQDVRAVGTTWAGSAVDYVDAPEPEPDGLPEGVAILVERLSVGRARELAHPPGGTAADLVLRDASFHIKVGETVALLTAGDPEPARLLLSVLSGTRRGCAGLVLSSGTVVGATPPEQGLEPTLSVAENTVILGTALGAQAAAVEVRLEEVLQGAGLWEHAGDRLQAAGAQTAERLCLAVALAYTSPGTLLVSDVPCLSDAPFVTWARGQVARLRAGGTAILQHVGDPAQLLAEPARVLWLQGGELRASGHAASVIEESRLHRLGFASAPRGWTEVGTR